MKTLSYDYKDWNLLGYFGKCEVYESGNKRLLAAKGVVCFTYASPSKVDEIISKKTTQFPVMDDKTFKKIGR